MGCLFKSKSFPFSPRCTTRELLVPHPPIQTMVCRLRTKTSARVHCPFIDAPPQKLWFCKSKQVATVRKSHPSTRLRITSDSHRENNAMPAEFGAGLEPQKCSAGAAGGKVYYLFVRLCAALQLDRALPEQRFVQEFKQTIGKG